MGAIFHAPAPTPGILPLIHSAPGGTPPTMSQGVKGDSRSSPCTAYQAAGRNADSASYGAALKVWHQFEYPAGVKNPNITYVIALAPDPIHTQLSLYFDRTMEAIQAAARDETYVYDSSWLPWQLDTKSYPQRADEDSEEAAVDSREACPGLLLFRKRQVPENDNNAPYSNGLAVFVVADEPTKGINSDEWNEALRLISAGEVDSDAKTLRVLGPTFSGSLPSLARLLGQESLREGGFRKVTIYSGAVSSCASIQRFQRFAEDAASGGLQGREPQLQVKFGTFSENSELLIYRLLMYFKSMNQSLASVAIISEDETAYGQSDAEPHGSTPSQLASCAANYGTTDVPVWLFYPRDISAVRVAYLEQSIFSRSRQSEGESTPPRTVLRPVVPVAPHFDNDTINSFSQDEIPLDEEARLYELVSFLRSHHSQYLVLRGSNPEDFIFLTRFFRHAYPEGRIIMLHSDELLRREIDTSEFRGVMSLTNYPLLPRDQHWSRLIQNELDGARDRHVHRIFPADNIEGEYLAARFLFDPKLQLDISRDLPLLGMPGDEAGPKEIEHKQAEFSALNAAPGALYTESFKENLPDYAEPVWLHPDATEKEQSSCKPTPCYPARGKFVSPSTWLVASGRDGYWPIAVITNDLNKTIQPPPSTITKLYRGNAVYYWPKGGRTSPVPWSALLMLILALGFFHAFGLWNCLADAPNPLGTVGRQEVFLLFGPSAHWRQGALLGIANAIVFCAALLLLLGPWHYRQAWELNYSARSLHWLTAVLCLVFFTVVLALIRNRQHLKVALPVFGIVILVWSGTVFFFTDQGGRTDAFGLLYRSAHITSGVSPLLPLLLVLAGLYLSAILSLRAIGLLVSAPVRLPRANTSSNTLRENKQTVERDATADGGSGPLPEQFLWISLQLGCQIDESVVPLNGRPIAWLLPFAVAGAAFWLFADEGGSLTLEGPHYSYTLLCCLMLTAVVAMSHALSLHQSWITMKLMLRALGREPLRRTFAALRALPDSSIWALGSDARGEQSRALSDEMESLIHLRNLISVESSRSRGVDEYSPCYAIDKCLFWARKYKESSAANLLRSHSNDHRRELCRWLGRSAEDVMNWILIPAWNSEKASLNLGLGPAKKDGGGQDDSSTAAGDVSLLSRDPTVRAAEEFICQVYIAYIKRVLSCMRAGATSIAILFLTLGAAISCYPILSRTTVVFALVVVVAVVFALIAKVYVEMARDEILSLMTGTIPGQLGTEFWIKIVGFGIGPLLGLVAAQFPAVAETILSVLGPSMNNAK